MTKFDQFARDVLKKVVESIEIPPTYYEAATQRYRSLAEWFHRQQSTIADEAPEVYPQGSFRLGTVTRPLNSECGYDLDLVCELRDRHKEDGTQADLKRRVGDEVVAYAAAHGMAKPKEGRRCWKLIYQGNPSFHIDSLPAVPEDEDTRAQVAGAIRSEDSIGPEVAATAIAITDKTGPRYEAITDDWQMSNPAGFAKWFGERMRHAAQARIEALLRDRVYTQVQDVPVYTWKTPLQIVVQVLKRHRDVMFAEQPDIKPISAIIATLAGRAYDGNEMDPLEALANVVERMPGLVRTSKPRVPNPANPGEDFADKWDAAHERAFFDWMDQVQADVRELRRGMESDRLRRFLRQRLGVSADDRWLSLVCAPLAVQPVPAQPRTVNVHTSSAPGPWRDG